MEDEECQPVDIGFTSLVRFVGKSRLLGAGLFAKGIYRNIIVRPLVKKEVGLK